MKKQEQQKTMAALGELFMALITLFWALCGRGVILYFGYKWSAGWIGEFVGRALPSLGFWTAIALSFVFVGMFGLSGQRK